MAIIIEDGTNVAGANSYCDVAYGDAYFASHLHSNTWDAATPENREVALIHATRTIETTVTWNGIAQYDDQALGFPRSYMYDKYNVSIDENTVPEVVKQATAEMAQTLLNSDVTSPQETGLKRAKISSIEVEFDKGDRTLILNDFVQRLLEGLGKIAYNRTIKLLRA